MSWRRLIFIAVGLSLVGLPFILNFCSHTQTKNSQGPFSWVQGLTTANSTQFTVVIPKSMELKYIVFQSDDKLKNSVKVERYSQSYSPWAVDRIHVNKLLPEKTYEIRAYNKNKTALDQRKFQTRKLSKNNIKAVVASCMDDSYHSRQLKMWNNVATENPDYIFLIGDNVYADKNNNYSGAATPEQLWQRYVETRNNLQIFFQPKLTPLLATWDDHDFGKNNGNRTYKYKRQATEVFQVFFGQDSKKEVLFKGPGVSFLFEGFGHRFVFMDNRTFRSQPEAKKVKNPTHWGQTQEKWLQSHISNSSKPTWIINGDQVFGGYHRFESFEGQHPSNFNTVMGKIKKARSPVAFLSGDRHLFEVMEIPKQEWGYKTFEITTSGIHAKMYPSSWDKHPNKRQVFGKAQTPNYLLLTSEASNDGWRLQINGKSADGTFYEKSAKIIK